MTRAPDTLASLQGRMGDRYRLERELGGGGMARVVLATEAELGRRVVLKLLSSEVAEGISVERFGREIRLAAALQDPHIVPVLAAGSTSDGIPFYTMPYVEGESLRQRMERGPVPLEDALRLLRDVAEALEYAHAHGVVHRDIKPENILLAGRNAVVADFGIAKAVSAARTQGDAVRAASATLTSIGTSLGTPAYMAPEQAAGEAVDHRADLYAWGLVAYELLAGRHPFADKVGLQQLLTAQLGEMPRALDAVRPSLPPALGALVMRCVAKDAADRPASATAVLAALADSGTTTGAGAAASRPRRPGRLVLASAMLAALVAVGAWVARGRRAPAPPATPAIAVLPFEHRGDPADSYITEGLADELRGKLAGVRELAVIARGSTTQYRGTTKPPQEIARELGVRWLLTAAVQIVGTGATRRVLVRPELVEIADDGVPKTRWSQPLDVQGADAPGLQGRIAGEVMSAMELTFAADDRARTLTVPTRDEAAYDAYLRGRAADEWGGNNGPDALARALPFYEEAVRRDSTYVEGWSQLAITRMLLFTNGRTIDSALVPAARAAVERTERLAPGSVEALRARGAYLRFIEHDYDAARQRFVGAAGLAPSDWRFRSSLGLMLWQELGRSAEAIPYFERARDLDPRNPRPLVNLGGALAGVGRYADARRALARARALNPSAPNSAIWAVAIELLAGDTARARTVARAMARETPPGEELAALGDAFMPLLDSTGAARVLAVGPELLGDRGAWAASRASMLAARGDSARARAYADTALPLLAGAVASPTASAQVLLDHAGLLQLVGRGAEARAALYRARRQLDAGSFGDGSVRARLLWASAVLSMELGVRDSALAWLIASGRHPVGFGTHLARSLRLFAPLRDDPRFQAALVAEQRRMTGR